MKGKIATKLYDFEKYMQSQISSWTRSDYAHFSKMQMEYEEWLLEKDEEDDDLPY